jgi:hypothetical protein
LGGGGKEGDMLGGGFVVVGNLAEAKDCEGVEELVSVSKK